MTGVPHDIAGIITAAGALLGPVIIGVFAWLRTRQAIRASAESDLSVVRASDVNDDVTVSNVILNWSQRLEAQVQRLEVRIERHETQITELKRENRLLRRHNDLLTHQVHDLGGIPVKMPGGYA